MYLIPFFLLYFFLQVSQSTSLTLQYILIYQSLYLKLKVGPNENSKFCKLDQQTPFTWFNSGFLSEIDLSSYKLSTSPTSIHFYPHEHFNVDLYSMQLLLNTTKLNLQFYYVKNGSTNGLTLSYHIDKTEFSLLHVLYNKNYITKRIYSIEPLSIFDGYIHFGDVPSYLINEQNISQSKGKCDIVNNKWACSISDVFINNTFVYNCNNKDSVMFQLREEKSYCSFEFLKFVTQSLNEQKIDDKQCEIKQKDDMSYYIECNSRDLIYGNNITFSIGEFLFELPLSTFFYIDRNFAVSTLLYNEDKCLYVTEGKEKQCWIFGTNFILNYVSVFNYEESMIMFICKENDCNIMKNMKYINSNIKVNEYKKYVLLICNVVLLMVNVLCLVLVKFGLKEIY